VPTVTVCDTGLAEGVRASLCAFGKALRITASLAGTAALLPGIAFAHGSAAGRTYDRPLLAAWQPDAFFLIPAGGGLGVPSGSAGEPRAPIEPRAETSNGVFPPGHGRARDRAGLADRAYDTDLFAVHMAQHMLIVMVAVPACLGRADSR